MASRNRIVGLDIGRATAKAVSATLRGGAFTVTGAEMVRLPMGEGSAAAVIGPWLKSQGLAGQPCVISVSGPSVMFQPLTIIPGDPRTDSQVAAIEMRRFNEMAAEPMRYACTAVAGRTGERRVLIAMARPAILLETLEAVRALGMDVVDMIPAAVALHRALGDTQQGPDAPVAFVNIGHSTTDLAVGKAGGLLFARSFASGGQMFTEAVARQRRITFAQAETLKLAKSLFLDKEDAAIVAACAKVADLWITELQSCLSVYHSLFSRPDERLRRMVLSGGGAALPGFAEYLRQKTGMEVIEAAQLPGGFAGETPGAFAVATGLAMLGLDASVSDLSLLPEDVRDDLVFRRQKPFWMASGVAAALILGVSLAGGYRDYYRKQEHLNSQKASLGRRQQLVAQIESAKARSDLIKEMAVPVQNLLRTGPLVRRTLAVVAEAKDPNDWVTLVCDGNTYYTGAPALPGAEGRATPGGRSERAALRLGAAPGSAGSATNAILDHIIIEGFTRRMNLSTVQRLITELNKADFVESADLLSDDKIVTDETAQTRGPEQGGRRFVIDVKVKGTT